MLSEADTLDVVEDDAEFGAATDTVAAGIELEQIINALKNDAEFFIQFFLGELLVFPVPEFHKVVFNSMRSQKIKRGAYALPRGTAKTTLAKLAVIDFFLFTDYSFIVYVSNTSNIAQDGARDIVAFMQCDNFKAVFGEIEFLVKREGDGYYIFRCPWNNKICILRAIGAGQQVRGINIRNRRPEMAVVDDLEDDENTSSEILRVKLKNWVYGPFFKAFNKQKAKIIWLGNMLHSKSMLHGFCKNPAWFSMLFGILLPGGKSLWPDMWPIEAIRAEYIEYVSQGLKARWFAEMMNLIIPEGGHIIPLDQIEYAPAVLPGDFDFGFLIIDPAISKRKMADHTSYNVVGFVRDRWQVIYSLKLKIDPKMTIDIGLALCNEWRLATIAIESQSYQQALSFFFRFFFDQYGVRDIEIVELYGQAAKFERIKISLGMMAGQEIVLTEGETLVTEQIIKYDQSRLKNDDDVLDGVGYIPQVLKHHMPTIMRTRIPPAIVDAVGFQSTYQVSAI